MLAREYFTAVGNGELPDELLTPDMTGWITCARPLRFTIKSPTADEDRVVAEHYNALIVQEKLMPLMGAAKAKLAGQLRS
jgi:hypothetical protein